MMKFAVDEVDVYYVVDSDRCRSDDGFDESRLWVRRSDIRIARSET